MTDRPWKGLTLPKSATGRSALVEPLPHHISSDSLHVEFRADPARVAEFLPPGLEPLDDGRGWAMIAEMAKVSAAEPDQYYRQPYRSAYNEGIVGFYCKHEGQVGRYSAFVWVDKDWSMGMGNIFGWSKRLADIHRTRLQGVNPGLPAHGPGAVVAGEVHRQGRSVLRAEVSIDENATQAGKLPNFPATTFLYRFIPSPSPDVDDVDQLFEIGFANTTMADIWIGEGRIEFGEAPNEELVNLGEVDCIEGYIYRRGWTTDRTARLLRDYSAEASGRRQAQGRTAAE